MNILFISSMFYPKTGGSQLYAFELLKQLKQDHPDDIIHVLAYNTEKTKQIETINGIEIQRVSCFEVVKSVYFIANPLSLIPKLYSLKNNAYDVVITQTRFFPPALWTWFYARLIKAKSVLIGHGTMHPKHSSRFVERAAELVDSFVSRFIINRYDEIITISKKTDEFYKKDLRVKKTVMIPGGLQTGLFEQRQPLFTNDKTIVSYIGRLIEAKGLNDLISAYSALSSDLRNNTELIIAGDGPMQEELSNIVKDNNLEVRFLGKTSYDDVVSLLKRTDIFINPSFNEGLPRTVLEAAASGCVVIATDVGGTNEIINNSTGLLIPPHNVEQLTKNLISILENPDKYIAYGARAKNHVRSTFDWNIVSKSIYKQIQC